MSVNKRGDILSNNNRANFFSKFLLKENLIFYISFFIIFTILSIIGLNKSQFEKITKVLLNSIITNFGFLYLIIVLLIALVCLYLCCSSYGDIRLGKDDSKPEYSNISWFSTLFTAGMGVAIVFFGAAAPMSHFVNLLGGIESGSTSYCNIQHF